LCAEGRSWPGGLGEQRETVDRLIGGSSSEVRGEDGWGSREKKKKTKARGVGVVGEMV